MTHADANASNRIWEAIENDKRRDRVVRKIAVIAWSITLALVLLLGALVGMQVAELAKGAMVGAVPWMAVFGVAMPFVIVLGILSVLIATLSTVGVFLRMRTASLAEIQLRLAALEGMITSRADAPRA